MTRSNKQQAAPKPYKIKSKNTRMNGAGPSRDITVSAPVASTKILRISVPKFAGSPYSGDGKITVRHREYIGEVNGSVSFAATQYAVNPGMAATFPWLSTIAANYESYKFRNLKFEFETEKSTATNGSIMMAIDFDAADSAPSTKQQLMTFQNAVRSAPWTSCEYIAATADLLKFGVQRYNRSATVASTDIKTYDVGNLVVATQGCADTSVIGELYVSYDVELHTPQQSGSSASAGGEKIVSAGSVSKTSVYGSSATVTGVSYFSAATNTLTCVVAGDYLVENNAVGTGLNAISNTLTGTATTTLLDGNGFQVGGGSTAGGSCFIVRATVGQTVIVDYSGATTLTALTTRITPYNYSLA